jgi:hypothetical protein
MILMTELPTPQCRRGELFEMRPELSEVVERYGITNVAQAADVSVQSIAKAMCGMRLYASTRRRLRAFLARKTP